MLATILPCESVTVNTFAAAKAGVLMTITDFDLAARVRRPRRRLLTPLGWFAVLALLAVTASAAVGIAT
jgi:hypothetical protein